ncbi:MAG TPA: hypothetical protein VJ848_04860 [Candidatus Angelobacter sp.]|nr:hypothetical protein [Candidatus Angelobacter sp.]
MPKKKTAKLPKKRTPNQAVHKAAKERKQQAQRVRIKYEMENDRESRSREDVNQAAARILRQATEG